MKSSASLKYYNTPLLRWSSGLPGSGVETDQSARHRNSVQISPDDELVYVTTSAGALYILDASNGSVVQKHVVNAYAVGWRVLCESGVSFYDGSEDQFAVYTVVDIPPSGSSGEIQSRVVSVFYPSGSRRWKSKPIAGSISGTPAVGSDGSFIYFTHNSGNGTVGHFTLLSASNGEIVFTEPSTLSGMGIATPYAPLALTHKPSGGNFEEGMENSNDVAIWGHSTDEGRASKGRTMAFQLPGGFSPGNTTDLHTITLRKSSWSTISKPTLSSDGQQLFFSVSKAGLRGWEGKRFSRGASWKLELTKSPSFNLQPLFSSPTLSSDELRLFSASASTSFHAVDPTSGNELWATATFSEIITEARISPDDKRVYTVERSNGKVTSYDTVDGTVHWSADCTTFQNSTPFCQYSVEAEFSLSSDGHTLYYGDTNGIVMALAVGYDPNATSTEAMEQNSSSTIATTYPKEVDNVAPSHPATNISATLETPSAEPSQTPTGAPTILEQTSAPSAKPSQATTTLLHRVSTVAPLSLTSRAPTVLPTYRFSSHIPTSSPTTLLKESPSSDINTYVNKSPSAGAPSPSRTPGALSSGEPSGNPWADASLEVIIVTAIVVASTFVFFALVVALIARLYVNFRRRRLAAGTLERSVEANAARVWPPIPDDDGADFTRVSC